MIRELMEDVITIEPLRFFSIQSLTYLSCSTFQTTQEWNLLCSSPCTVEHAEDVDGVHLVEVIAVQLEGWLDD